MYSLRSLIYLNINFYFLIKKLFQLNFIRMVHEKEIYSFKFLNFNKNTIILDIGGSDGLFYKSVRKINIQNKVVLIEPLKANLKHLKNIKKKNKNFKFYNNAISNQSSLRIFTPKINEREILNFTSFSKKKIIDNLKKNFKFLDTNLIEFNVSKVKTKKLDYFNKYNIGILKLDVEGYEQNIINSGKKLIREQKPIIYIENNAKIFKTNLFLKKLGYSAYFFNMNKKIFSKQNNFKSNYALLLIKNKHIKFN